MLEEQDLRCLWSCNFLGAQRMFGQVLHTFPGLCTFSHSITPVQG